MEIVCYFFEEQRSRRPKITSSSGRAAREEGRATVDAVVVDGVEMYLWFLFMVFEFSGLKMAGFTVGIEENDDE